ncbi:response regulator transcription factor [Sphingobacterium sp. MYb388]|uniref:response regulator transcription factor n=1 Tax=Sphingobacterium sp. MYb388 TaxID=2745437 RepID=UPI0030B56C09
MFLQRKLKVAYVEEHTGLRTLVCDYLESYGEMEVVLQTDNGYELLEFLKRCLPLPDICIMAISIPILDGISLLKKIKKMFRDLPCIIFSMHRNFNTVVKALSFGANAYISKHEDHRQLYRVVREVYKNGIAFSALADPALFESVRSKRISTVRLSAREKEFMVYASTDETWLEIAARMGVTINTIMTYKSRCFKKLKVGSRVSLAMQALRLGLVQL